MHYLSNMEIRIKTKIKQRRGLTEIATLKLEGGGAGGGGGASTSLRSTNPRLSSALVPQTLSCMVCMEDS